MSRIAIACLPVLVAVAPVAAQTAPAPAASPAAPAPGPASPPQPEGDRLEQLLWQGASASNTAPAYATYLNRYPQGPHAVQAHAAMAQAPATAAVSAAPPAAPPPVESEPPPFLCRPVFAEGEAPFEQAGEAEIGAYLQALRINSLGAYQAYLAAFLNGVFAPEVADLIATRQGRMSAPSKPPGGGMTTARALAPLAPVAADYPSIALRDAREGAATAIWEIAEDGCVEACRIDKSSGSQALDAATCRVVTIRGRYDPATNAEGKPVRSVDSATFTWRLPQH